MATRKSQVRALGGAPPQVRIGPQTFRDNLLDRVAEAEREGWLGETEGLPTVRPAPQG
ncbi:hypothetical protein [Streptomyces sp. NPDC055681]